MKSALTLSLIINVCILISILELGAVCERIIYSTVSEVGAGNITHYSLKQEGCITLILHSAVGDADIYISESNPKPDYLDYDMQSATCGRDVVTIPKDFKRPVGIGVFGHVYHPVSKYELIAVLDYDMKISDEDRHSGSFLRGDEDSSESTVWVVFVNILKIIVEILA